MTTATERPAPPRRPRRSPAWLATIVAVPVTAVLLLVAIVAASRGGRSDPAPAPTPAATSGAPLPAIRVAAPPAPDAGGQKACRELISALPTDLGDLPARPVDSPSPYVVAWGEPAVTLRCGVARPPAFVATADVQQISGVAWFAERRGPTTAWTVVDRPVYVEVLVPAAEASGPVARLSTAVARSLKAQPLDPAN
ncbi:MAG TPA: DUF3515 domain-containing protein [Mycobacteriales bacterium]|nr:DUF3515 domain-containing protein [Mycobacteriales bacterium]